MRFYDKQSLLTEVILLTRRVDLHGEKIEIANKQFNEIINATYSFDIKFDVAANIIAEDSDIPPLEDGDWIERKQIVRAVTYNGIRLLHDDLNTRQFVIQPKYQGNDELAACISLIQIMYRHNMVYVHAYYRSQHVNNLAYDILTLLRVYARAANVLYTLPEQRTADPRKGYVTVHIGSLHKDI